MSIAIASIIGFFHAFIPNIFDVFQDKRDKAQELAILQIQLENNKVTTASKEREVVVQAQAQTMQTLYETANKPTGIGWIDGVNALIRPLMAYLIVFDYVLVTYLSYLALMTLTLSPEDIIKVLWSKETEELFAVIVTFYFGSKINGKA